MLGTLTPANTVTFDLVAVEVAVTVDSLAMRTVALPTLDNSTVLLITLPNGHVSYVTLMNGRYAVGDSEGTYYRSRTAPRSDVEDLSELIHILDLLDDRA
ncbi:hypothetical protein ACFYVL_17300 [Streptomyces sp. NPDC004111]|uniref:hypothetical protein n=1 Tax=Streptomyces sp. NPDC004111 TaxID=3364690 RepID=UPI0036919C93